MASVFLTSRFLPFVDFLAPYPAKYAISCYLHKNSSPTILMLDLISVPRFWFSFRGLKHLLDHKALKQSRQFLATSIDVWLKNV